MDRVIISKHTDSRGDSYALCSIHGGKEYVTWACNSTFDEFFWGHYFKTIEDAEADFKKRCKL